MNVLLLTNDPDLSDLLCRPCERAGMHLRRIALDAVVPAALTVEPPDLVVLDCERCPLENAERCAAFVRWALAPVLVVHGTEGFVEAVRASAGVVVHGLSIRQGWRTLLPYLRQLRNTLLACKPQDAVAELTERQVKVLDLVVKGVSYGEIAEQRGVSKGTIKKDVYRIKEKLGVHDGEELQAAGRALLRARGLMREGEDGA